jgi:hypothetical protein
MSLEVHLIKFFAEILYKEYEASEERKARPQLDPTPLTPEQEERLLEQEWFPGMTGREVLRLQSEGIREAIANDPRLQKEIARNRKKKGG